METKENEIWSPVKDYEGLYEINKQGKVKSLQKHNYGYIMNQRIDRGGYFTVRLAKPSIRSSTKYVHRLLGFAFIQNPNNKPFINHIDGNKLNNSISNLEWLSHAENMKHAYSTGLIIRKTKQVIDTCSGQRFNSLKEACKAYGIIHSTLRNYLSGNIKNNPTCLQYAA